jgi:tRNA ligase
VQKKERDLAALPKKTILVPCAVPGCGKTLVGLALAKLYGFGHTQSDDVTAKRSAPTFLKNIEKLLKTNDVVYADR